jgi:U32 family peptidase
MKKPELLSPAGGWEQLKYAIHFGADAVYFASDKFGMRAHANNFKLDEVSELVNYAHSHNVKTYVTCNIVMHQDNLDQLPPYLEAFEAAGVDSIILEDFGALRLAKKYAPSLKIHVSTQASVANAQAALMWHELGASRIVCARELSLRQIAEMRKQLPDTLELEAFVHGSMCMAYSGRCLISDYLTGRSAVQGDCTQPCRWGYTLEEEKREGEHFPIEENVHGSYIMNAQDMNMLKYIDNLRDAGIDSLKIEGRNKKAFYVATVTNAYRKVLDGESADFYEGELESTSHRPFSTGFFFGPAHQNASGSGYIQKYDWVVEVLDCKKCDEGWKARVKCRNRFFIDSELEVLTPHTLPYIVHISKIEYIPHPDSSTEIAEACDIANVTMGTYDIYLDSEVKEMDILRTKRS